MFFAARKMDPVTHDLLVPSGMIGPPITGPCPTGGPVMIEGLPAAHISCTVVCSGAISAGLVHPPPPGPPPPVAMGSPTVYVHGMPLSRWVPSGDVGSCGCFLGDPKLAATRRVMVGAVGGPGGAGAPGMGGLGGVLGAMLGGLLLKLGLASPYPRAVLQPDGSVVTEYTESIRITGTPEFQARTLRDLETLAGTPTGRGLIDSFEGTGQAVTIREGASNGAAPADGNAAVDGSGTDTTVTYNPNSTRLYDHGPTAQGQPGREPWMDRPPEVGLGHELVHAHHNAHGTNDFTSEGERMAVGLGPQPGHPQDRSGEPYTENGIRNDLGEPARTRYGQLGPP